MFIVADLVSLTLATVSPAIQGGSDSICFVFAVLLLYIPANSYGH